MLHQRLIFSVIPLVLFVAGCSNRTSRPSTPGSPEVLSLEHKLGDTKQSTSSTQRTLPESSIPADTLIVNADFPGGNVIVDHIEGDTIFLRPDYHNSSEWWFYWYFRIRGAAGRTLKFQFIGKNPIGTEGPAFSTDGGHTWFWLGRRTVQDSSFTYSFDQQCREVRFCFSIPYLQANLQEFLRKYADNPHVSIHQLCRSRKGRYVERLHAGKIDANPKYRILLTARHHACETIASYTLEGFLETVVSDTDLGRWFRNNVELLAIPFVDKDGVEAGDQGKNRKPHDHNRDYARKSIYPSIEAIRHFVPEWSQGKFIAAIDLHCPHISGEYNEVIYIVGSPDPAIWREQQEFADILESVREGALPYSADSSMPFGRAWNTAGNYAGHKSFSRWASEQAGVLLATTIEIPYANVGTTPVTVDNARDFGADIARALRQYLEGTTGK